MQYIITFFFNFQDGSEDQIKAAKSAMTPIATPYFEKNKDKNNSLCFLYTIGNPLDSSIQELLKISVIPSLAIVNISSDAGASKAVYGRPELNQEAVKEFLKEFEEKSLSFEILQ